jgi:hypothetical protein
MSITSIRTYEILRNFVSKNYEECWVTNHAIRPVSLFTGISQRVSIFIANKNLKDSNCLWYSNYLRTKPDLKVLFEQLKFVNVNKQNSVDGIKPKLATCIEQTIWEKLFKKNAQPFLFLSNGTHTIHFKDYGETYWIYPLSIIPYLTPVKSYNKLTIEDKDLRDCLISYLNSSLFYWFYTLISDCWHFGKWHMQNFHYGLDSMSSKSKSEMLLLHNKLMESYISNRITRYDSRINGELFEYKVSSSKPIIDEIDRVLAQHYGFTDEELDFIINYDIKYRMGKGLEAEEE